MAKELLVSVAIGAVLQGSYMAAFGGAKRTLDTLGAASAKLKKQHDQLGEAMQRAMGKLSGGTLAAINRDYEKLGRTLDALRQKQEKLAASMAKGVDLKNARQEHWAGMKESAATAVAVGAPFLASVKQASKFEAGLRDIAITGNLKGQEEVALGEAMRRAALSTNQGHAAIQAGVNTLVAAGMNANRAGDYAALLGKAATAGNAETNDMANMIFSLEERMGIKGEAQMKEALNRVLYGAKLGQFEAKAVSRHIPELANLFAAKGITGQEGLTQIIASLEVGRSAAGSDGEAVTNLVNWMSHMNTDHTTQAYLKAGVKYQESMQNLVVKGYSSYEASLQIADKFITSKGDAFMAEWQKAGKAGDENAQRQLMESFGLNEVFTDIQTINHLLAMRQNWDKYQKNKKDMGSQQALGTIDEDYIKRTQTMQKAWERFTTQITDVAITIGSAFLPALADTLDGIAPVVRAFGGWAKANPGLLRGIVGVVGGLLAMRTGIFALRFLGNFMFLAPANSVATAWLVLTSRFTLFRALLLGTSSRFSLLLQFFGMGADRAAKLAGWFGKLGGWALSLGKTLGGALMSGARLAGQAVLWLGRAFLMNPIGLAITGIALGAYLIYRYWKPIKAFFLGLWSEVRAAFAGGIGGVARLILNWSPLGLFYRAFAGVMRYFGVNLPKNFSDFGSMLIDGLVGGIKAKLTAARDSIVSFGNSIKGWFTSTLGIKSPSRVFMGFGDNIAEGAAIGIQRTGPLASRAAAAMANATATAAQGGGGRGGRAAGGLAAAGSGMVIHFSPNITVQGGGDAKGAVMEAAQLSLVELERLIRRLMDQQQRRSN
jgi:TP901 family phage tail tape measure protein